MSANRKDVNTAANGVTLQHRHFAFIAATIAALPEHAPTLRAQKAAMASAFADACARTNPKFDRARFIAACFAEASQ
jgi:hypothetical protein